MYGRSFREHTTENRRRVRERLSEEEVKIDLGNIKIKFNGKFKGLEKYVETTIFHLDENFRVVWMNDQVVKNIERWEKATGKKAPKKRKDEILGERWVDFLQGEEKRKFLRIMELAKSGKVVYQVVDIEDMSKSQCESEDHRKVINVFIKKGDRYLIVSFNLTKAFDEAYKRGSPLKVPLRKTGIIDDLYVESRGVQNGPIVINMQELLEIRTEEQSISPLPNTSRAEEGMSGKNVVDSKSRREVGDGFVGKGGGQANRKPKGRGKVSRKDTAIRRKRMKESYRSEMSKIGIPKAAKAPKAKEVVREEVVVALENMCKQAEMLGKLEHTLQIVDNTCKASVLVKPVLENVEYNIKEMEKLPVPLTRQEEPVAQRLAGEGPGQQKQIRATAKIMVNGITKARSNAGEAEPAEKRVVRPFTLEIEVMRKWRNKARG